MKPTTVLSILCLLLIFNFLEIKGQNRDYYSLKLSRVYQDLQFDTVVPIDFLKSKTDEGIVNMQFFEGFNYPKLEYKKAKNSIILFNDTIEIEIATAPFDQSFFLRNYLIDSSLYFKNIYYQAIPYDVFLKYPYYPETVVSEITVKIQQKKIHLPSKEYSHLYNPNTESWMSYNTRKYGINAYIAQNKKILLTLFCGEGAGASIVIFILRPDGSFESSIMGPVI